MKLTLVAGARPNFMKIAPIIEAIEAKKKHGADINYRLVHTGQHYDEHLSGRFFDELHIPRPDINLGVGSGTQAEQTAAIIKVAHVEAGIRSGDMGMPEEINRIVTDSLTDYFFTTSDYANANLKGLGVPESKIFFVGNVMIDTLLKQEPRFKQPTLWNDLDLSPKNYVVLTLHRPGNVDDPQVLKQLVTGIANHSKGLPVIFPVHPRTEKLLRTLDLKLDSLHCLKPLGYLEFNYLVKNAQAVITDSGGVTEETTVMQVPCMTLRTSTERPETCAIGTNVLVGNDPEKIEQAFDLLHDGQWKTGGVPELWDGHAAVRIVGHLMTIFEL